MTFLRSNGVIMKAWYLLRTYILTLKRFDLFLQGSMFIVILLQSNVFLLLRRDHGGGLTPASVEDWVLVAAGMGEFLMGSVLGWWGRHRRNLALSAWLAAAAVAGSLVMIFPFENERSADVELCGGSPIIRPTHSDEPYKTVRLALLIISAIFCSLTQASIWAHGMTYLDDHEPHNGPYFYGILISIRLSLGLSGQGWLQPSSLREEWWHSHLSLCSLTLMFAILFTLFPKRMKDFEVEDDYKDVDEGFFPSLQRVFSNKLIILQTIAISLMTTAVFGFIHYDRAYVQAKFHVEAYRQDPRTSRATSDIFRSLVIIFFIMIFRVRFSDRRADGVKAGTAARVGGVVAVIVAVFLAVIAGISCDVGEIEREGGSALYEQPGCSAYHCGEDIVKAGTASRVGGVVAVIVAVFLAVIAGISCGVGEIEREGGSALYEQPGCSAHHSGCDSARYGFSPVCGLDSGTTFFSPCHAGCSHFEDLHGFIVYQDCSCGMQRAVPGACSIHDCRSTFSVYQVLYTIFLAVSGASLLMQGMVILRSVRREDKPIAMGASFAVVALLSYVIGHVLYMGISYLTCMYRDDGRCVLHHPTLWIVVAVSSVLAVCSAVVSLISSRVAVPLTEL